MARHILLNGTVTSPGQLDRHALDGLESEASVEGIARTRHHELEVTEARIRRRSPNCFVFRCTDDRSSAGIYASLARVGLTVEGYLLGAWPAVVLSAGRMQSRSSLAVVLRAA